MAGFKGIYKPPALVLQAGRPLGRPVDSKVTQGGVSLLTRLLR